MLSINDTNLKSNKTNHLHNAINLQSLAELRTILENGYTIDYIEESDLKNVLSNCTHWRESEAVKLILAALYEDRICITNFTSEELLQLKTLVKRMHRFNDLKLKHLLAICYSKQLTGHGNNYLDDLLMLNIKSGCEEVVRFLLSCGANPNLKLNNETPLHLAITEGAVELVEILLMHDVDPLNNLYCLWRIQPSFENTRLYSAFRIGNLKIIKIMLLNLKSIDALGIILIEAIKYFPGLTASALLSAKSFHAQTEETAQCDLGQTSQYNDLLFNELRRAISNTKQ